MTTPRTGPAHYVVNTADGASDARPGDGRCEVTVGAGDCTLQAAMDEAHHQAKTIITLVGFDTFTSFSATVTTTVTTDVTIRADRFTEYGPTIDSSAITVADGAVLRLESVEVPRSDLHVDGQLTMTNVVMIGSIDVGPTGRAQLSGVLMTFGYSTAIRNRGQVDVRFSTLDTRGETQVLETLEDGRTTLGASVVRPGADSYPPVTTTCTGIAPISVGFNVTTDDTCALSESSDQIVGYDVLSNPDISPAQLDVVPAGTLGCGTTAVRDIRNIVRPADGNGDGTAACDIGAWERPARDAP